VHDIQQVVHRGFGDGQVGDWGAAPPAMAVGKIAL
jgi:hypothetical protein